MVTVVQRRACVVHSPTSTSTTRLAMKMKVQLKASSSSRDTTRQPPSLQRSTAGGGFRWTTQT